MTMKFYTSYSHHEVGDVIEPHIHPWKVILDGPRMYPGGLGTYEYDVMPAISLGQWYTQSGWMPYGSGGGVMYKDMTTGIEYPGPHAHLYRSPPPPTPWPGAAPKKIQTLGEYFKILDRQCKEHVAADTGLRVSFCKKCDARLEWIDWSWIAKERPSLQKERA